MKIALRALALLASMTSGVAWAGPIPIAKMDVSSVVLIQRSVRVPEPHPVELPPAPHFNPSSGHLNSPPGLIRPRNFDPARPGPDLVVDGGAVKTQQELDHENTDKRRDCPSATDETKPDNCVASPAPPR